VDVVCHSSNEFLASLSPGDFELLRPHLKSVDLVHKTVLVRAGDVLDRVYFPTSGIISLVVSLAAGQTTEAAMIGRDSAFGALAALDGGIALIDALIQLKGTASVIQVAQLRKAADASPSLRGSLMRHEQALLVQALQSAACNASHTVEARLSRWLLRARDLADSDSMAFTQEFLAQMLGVRRSSVSLVAHTLQRAGLIRYRRGHIEITDLEGLRDSSCECYGAIKANYEKLLGAQ